METELSRLLDALPEMVWTATPDGTCNFVNRRWRDYTGLDLEAAVAAGWASIFHPDDLGPAMAAWRTTLADTPPAEINVVARLRRFDGVHRRFMLQTRPLRDRDGRLVGWCGTNADIEDRVRAEAQLAAEKRLLEMVARGVGLPAVLDELCVQVERLCAGSFCSILFVDETGGGRFRVGAGPSLPAAYNAALEGLKIDPGYGPCSMAVETRATVIAADPPRDKRWAASPWPDLVTGFGLLSCWSAPIFGSPGDVLGIFAIYKGEPQGPSAEEVELIDRFARIAGIAIERTRADAALKATAGELRRAHDHMAQAQRLSRTGSFTTDFASDTHTWSEELYRILEFEPGTPVSIKAFRALIHPEDQARFAAGFQAAVETGADFDEVFRLVTPKGAQKHLHAVATRIVSGGVTTFMGSIQDVTESRLSEEALRHGQAELRRAHDQLAQAQRLSRTGSFTSDWDVDHHVWSEELYRILEFEPGAPITFEDFRTRIHPDDMKAFMSGFQKVLSDGEEFGLVFRWTTPKGNLRYLHAVSKKLEGAVTIGAVQDVTESKLAEAALRASAADLRRVNRYLAGGQRLSKTGSFTWDVANNAQDWSDELYRIWEMEPGEDRSIPNLCIHPDDRAEIEAIVDAAVAAGESYEISYRIVTRSGAVKHLRTVNERLADVPGQLLYVGATQDLTEIKQAEAALKASEARVRRVNRYLSAAQRLSRIGSFTWDVESDDLDFSDENFRIWELDPTETPTLAAILAAIHPEDLQMVVETIADARASGDDFDVFYRITSRGGGVKHIHTVSTRIPEITDRVVYVGSNQDVTESRLAEAELARANTYLTAAQRLSQTGSFTWDVEADEHNWSEVIYRVFGFEPGSRVTMDMMMRAIHPDDLSDVMALVGGAQVGENFELVFRVINTDGGIRHAHVVGHRIESIPERPVFMGALQDITSRKMAEDDLNRARAELAHVSRAAALSTLTASIAHEVSQPLAGILANASTSQRLMAAEPPNLEGARVAVQRTLRDGHRASEVIKRLRALFSRKPPTLECVDLSDATREVLALSASELQRRRIIVRAELPADLPCVQADRIQLQQVILNLVLNAADAMADVQGRPRELGITARRVDDRALSLQVRDAGAGIDAADVEELFEAFHTSKPEGMGIGLSISRSIIEAHGGRLSAAPNPDGVGATFSFVIPCDANAVAAPSARKA